MAFTFVVQLTGASAFVCMRGLITKVLNIDAIALVTKMADFFLFLSFTFMGEEVLKSMG